MGACEKCWNDAYSRCTADTSKSQTEHYNDLLEERKDNPCDMTNKPDCLTKYLEKLFNRGFNHGLSKGLSDDGETYAVSDARTQIIELFLESLPKDKVPTTSPENPDAQEWTECESHNAVLATIREKWGLK